jgi:hypothetical protein
LFADHQPDAVIRNREEEEGRVFVDMDWSSKKFEANELAVVDKRSILSSELARITVVGTFLMLFGKISIIVGKAGG